MAKSNFCSACGVTSIDRNRQLTNGMCAGCDKTKQNTTQQIVLGKILPLLHPPSAIDNKMVGGAQCNTATRFPDTAWVTADRVVYLEIDEHSHADRPIVCELAKLDDSRFGVAGGGIGDNTLLHAVTVRLNPDACDRPAPNLTERCNEAAKRLQHYLTCPLTVFCPHRANVHFLFYHTDAQKHIDAALGKPDSINVLCIE
jgi:hypothetical protein